MDPKEAKMVDDEKVSQLACQSLSRTPDPFQYNQFEPNIPK